MTTPLERKLLEVIESWNLPLPGELQPDTPLIESGVFDSLALFNLVLWVEEQVGAPIDASSLDPVREWNCVRDILAFVERLRLGNHPR